MLLSHLAFDHGPRLLFPAQDLSPAWPLVKSKSQQSLGSSSVRTILDPYLNPKGGGKKRKRAEPGWPATEGDRSRSVRPRRAAPPPAAAAPAQLRRRQPPGIGARHIRSSSLQYTSCTSKCRTQPASRPEWSEDLFGRFRPPEPIILVRYAVHLSAASAA